MSNFYDLGTAMIDVNSIAYIDPASHEVVMKSGFVFSARHFTHLEVTHIAQIVRKSNTIYSSESLLFLSEEEVSKELHIFITFMGYPSGFEVKYTRKNDHVYTLEGNRTGGLYQRVHHFNANDHTSAVLGACAKMYEDWVQGENTYTQDGEGEG